MTEEETTKEDNKNEYKLVNVPTQHTLAIKSPNGDIMNIEESIVLLLNKVEEVKSLIG